jgi:hypothetical protein
MLNLELQKALHKFQPLTEMSNENGRKKIMFLGSKVRPVRGTDKLTAFYEPIFYKMWDP